jgi:hypothetical protein
MNKHILSKHPTAWCTWKSANLSLAPLNMWHFHCQLNTPPIYLLVEEPNADIRILVVIVIPQFLPKDFGEEANARITTT